MYAIIAIVAGTILASAAPSSRECIIKHNGENDTQNILDAFEQCKDGGRVIFAKGKSYTLGPVITTPELSNVEIVFQGDLVYPFNISFFTIQGKDVKVTGEGGSIYGTGEEWWYLDPLPSNRPVMMTFMVENLDVRSMRLINSPNWNFYVHRSKNVQFDDIFVNDVDTVHGESPHNSDGWDTSETDGISITNSYINNGDDCVAIKTNTSNIHIENLYCNGSHGISVGSLGNIPEKPDYISNMYVKNVTCDNCQNGARIKTWALGALGEVRNVSYIDFRVTNSDHPLTIDQCYFNIEEEECKANPSKIQMKDITFKNITGSGNEKAGSDVVTIICSAEAPCENFNFDDINIATYDPSSVKPAYICENLENSESSGLDCSSPIND
ncbi:pectin lyase-like protein [Lichtheimia hyalospora FSU 10163]|nr:pectin lyase-like protein [Lichtheimia hyalospora FSU 10163]